MNIELYQFVIVNNNDNNNNNKMRKAELNRWHIFYTYTENGVEKMKNSLV